MSASRRPIGSTDDQKPHAEDEVYYVIRGRAMFESADGAVPVAAGSLVFVPAGAEHRFADITVDMQTLIFWSPARAATPVTVRPKDQSRGASVRRDGGGSRQF